MKNRYIFLIIFLFGFLEKAQAQRALQVLRQMVKEQAYRLPAYPAKKTRDSSLVHNLLIVKFRDEGGKITFVEPVYVRDSTEMMAVSFSKLLSKFIGQQIGNEYSDNYPLFSVLLYQENPDFFQGSTNDVIKLYETELKNIYPGKILRNAIDCILSRHMEHLSDYYINEKCWICTEPLPTISLSKIWGVY